MQRGSSRSPRHPASCVVILSILFLGSNAHAATLNVCTNGCRFASIGAAIVAARPGDTISIARGTYFENLVIRKRLTLSGSGSSQTIIDGSQSNRVVTIASNVTVVLQNLTIQNGMVTGAPGQSVFGGGIFSEGILTMRNVAVISNTISGGYSVNGGIGGQAQGGGIFSRGRLNLTACSFLGNCALAGGGNYSANIAGTGADAAGAGIYSDGRLDAAQCVFRGNIAVGALGVGGNGGNALGGAVFCKGGLARIRACRLARNSAQGEYSFGHDIGNGRGGGLYNETVAEVSDSVIESNSTIAFLRAAASLGGGVYNSGTLSLSRCVIVSNSANLGGGLFNARQVSASTCQLCDNRAEVGGGIFNDRTLTMQNCHVRANSAAGRDDWPNPYSGYGGGLYNACTARVAACWVEDNTSGGGRSEYTGGSAYGAGVFNEGYLSLLNSTLNGNTSAGRDAFGGAGDGCGGAVFNAPSGRMDLENSTLSGNRAKGGSAISAGDGRGGGIYNQGIASLNHCTFFTNFAQQGLGQPYGPSHGSNGDGSGGGIYAESPVEIAHSILAGNGASVSGFDCNGILESEGYNIIGSTSSCTVQGVVAGNIFGVNPLLGSLRACGGFAPTHPLLPGSPALDAGMAGGLVADQRGAPRVTNIPNVPNAGDGSDIGAYETKKRDVVITKSASPEMPVPGQPITYTIEVSNVGLTPMSSVTVLDLLPRDVSFLSSVPRPWNGRAFGGIAAYNIGNLGVASQSVITIQASVRRTATGVIENNAWTLTPPRDDFSLNNQISLESVISPP